MSEAGRLQSAMTELLEQLSEAVARRERGLRRWEKEGFFAHQYPDVTGVSQVELNERVEHIARAISELAVAATSAAKGGSLV
jgi:hypothetical protein